MISWQEFRERETELAEMGRALFYQYGGVGLAFMATVRADGGPRLHPMCPLINDDGMFAFIIPSPKREDLLRDGRYALQPFPPEENDDAFYVTGRVARVTDPEFESRLAGQFFVERKDANLARGILETWIPFEFLLESVLHSKTKGHGGEPVFTKWRATSSRAT